MTDKTIRELQTSLPWTIRYSRDFRANPQPHKDFTHALLHVVKAVGKLQGLADDMDHDREVADDSKLHEAYGKYVADLVVCALRAANVFPGGVLDLQSAVQERIKVKNDTTPAMLTGNISDGGKPVWVPQDWVPQDVNEFRDSLRTIVRSPIKEDKIRFEAFDINGVLLGSFMCTPSYAKEYARSIYGYKVHWVTPAHEIKK